MPLNNTFVVDDGGSGSVPQTTTTTTTYTRGAGGTPTAPSSSQSPNAAAVTKKQTTVTVKPNPAVNVNPGGTPQAQQIQSQQLLPTYDPGQQYIRDINADQQWGRNSINDILQRQQTNRALDQQWGQNAVNTVGQGLQNANTNMLQNYSNEAAINTVNNAVTGLQNASEDINNNYRLPAQRKMQKLKDIGSAIGNLSLSNLAGSGSGFATTMDLVGAAPTNQELLDAGLTQEQIDLAKAIEQQDRDNGNTLADWLQEKSDELALKGAKRDEDGNLIYDENGNVITAVDRLAPGARFLAKGVAGAVGQAPQMVANAFVPGGGDIWIGASSFGNAWKEAKERGLSNADAATYAALTALIEVVSNRMFQGTKFDSEGIFDSFKSDILKNVKSPTASLAAKYLADVLGEQIEEESSTITEYLLDWLALGKNADENGYLDFAGFLSDINNTWWDTLASTVVLNTLTGGYSSDAAKEFLAEMNSQELGKMLNESASSFMKMTPEEQRVAVKAAAEMNGEDPSDVWQRVTEAARNTVMNTAANAAQNTEQNAEVAENQQTGNEIADAMIQQDQQAQQDQQNLQENAEQDTTLENTLQEKLAVPEAEEGTTIEQAMKDQLSPDIVDELNGVQIARSAYDNEAQELHDFGKNINRDIVIVKELPNRANGMWKDGRIYISERAYSRGRNFARNEVAKHELLHSLKGANVFNDIIQYAQKQLGIDNEKAYEAYMNELLARGYDEQYGFGKGAQWKDLDDAGKALMQEEATAFWVQNNLFQDQAAVDRLVRTSRSTAERVWQSLKDLVRQFLGIDSKEAAMIRRAERMFAQALSETNEQVTHLDPAKNPPRDVNGNVITEEQARAVAEVGPNVLFSVDTHKNPRAKGRYVATANSGKGGFTGLKDKVSGKTLLYDSMLKRGFSQEQTNAVVGFLDHMAEYLTDKTLQGTYQFIGWNDLENASVTVRQDSKGNIVSIAVSAMVANGEYPVNFDLTTICNKREGMMQVIKELANIDIDVDGKGTKRSVLNSIKLTDENMWRINEALKAEGIDTACLGCFVEARRYYTNRFIDKIDAVWNAKVRETRSALGLDYDEYFDFAGGRKVKGKDYEQISDLWTSYNKSKASKSSPEQRVQAIMDEILRTGDVNSPYLKLISPADVLTPEGIRGFKELSTHRKDRDMVKLIKSIYGTSAPKEILAFTPYNSEIALLPEKIKGQPIDKYLRSIGGTRVQSFSDFKMEHFFDHLQMVADEAMRKFTNHGYSKVIAYPRLFGLTGRKINMSVMFDVLPAATWKKILKCSDAEAEEFAKKYQGLQFVRERPSWYDDDSDPRNDHRPYKPVTLAGVDGYLTYLVSDADYINSIYDKLYQQYLAQGMSPEKARRKANQEKPFEQSINYREAVELENREGYKENVGIVAVSYGDEHFLMLLDDPNVRYIIPYHRSGLPVFIAAKTSLDKARDFTIWQNTGKAPGGMWKNAAGENELLIDTYDKFLAANPYSKFPAIDFFNMILKQGYTVELDKKSDAEKIALAGTGTFDVYENLDKVSDIKEISNAYLDHCIRNSYVPVFYDFAWHPNYYKVLFDFAVVDGEGNIHPQRPVRNVYPGVDLDEIADELAATGMTMEEFVAKNPERFAELYAELHRGLAEQNEKARIRETGMGNVLADILSATSENSIIAGSNINSIVNGTPDLTNPKTGDGIKGMLPAAMMSLPALSEQQEEYFQGSKVRDRDGNLLDMYHGTNGDVDIYSELSSADPDAIVERHNRENGMNIPLDYRRNGGRRFNAETMQLEDNPDDMFSFPTDEEYASASDEQKRKWLDEKAKASGLNSPQVWHGTEGHFNTFRPEPFRKEINGENKIQGWFSEDKDYADHYGDHSDPYYVGIDNPLDFTDAPFANTIDGWKKWFADHGVTGIKFDSSIYKDPLKWWQGPGSQPGDPDAEYSVFDIFDGMDYWQNDGNLTERIQAAGYDGMRWGYDEDAWIPFNNKKIKSTDLITYDDNGDPIPFSKRMDTGNPDTRFSLPSNAEYKAAVDSGDMEEAQWMVDEAANEAGYTEEMFHGTPEKFTSFDIDKSRMGNSGFGIYFGNRDTAAEFAGENLLDVFVKTDNLGSYDTHKITAKQFVDALHKLGLSDDKTYKRYVDTAEEYVNGHNDYYICVDLQHWANLSQYYSASGKKRAVVPSRILSILRKTFGLDGIRNNRETVLWDNTLVKSAAPVTYDDNGNVIPLSERFNPKKNDIRWSLPGRAKISKVAENTFANTNFIPEEAKKDMGLDTNIEQFAYMPKSEAKSIAGAEARLEADWSGEEQYLMGKDNFTGEDNDAAMRIMKKKHEEGNIADYLRWAKKIREMGTQGGQFVQSFAKYTRNPEAFVIHGDKLINDALEKWEQENPKEVEKIKQVADHLMNWFPSFTADITTREGFDAVSEYIRALARKNKISIDKMEADYIAEQLANRRTAEEVEKAFEKLQADLGTDLTGEEVDEIYEYLEEAKNYPDTSKEAAELHAKAAAVIAKKLNSSWQEKWDAWRYLAMLGNTRTHVRNTLGNAVFGAVVDAKNAVAGPLEAAVAKVKPIERTKTGNIAYLATKKGKALYNAALSDANDVYTLLTGEGKYNINKDIDNQKPIFRTKALEWLRQKNGDLLEAEDWFFLQRDYAKYLSNYLYANGLDASVLKDENNPQAMKARAYAVQEAKKATFRNDNAFADKFSNFVRDLRGSGDTAASAFGNLLEGVVPFKKTPANILERGIEYSPANIVKTIKDGLKMVRKGSVKPAQFIDDIATTLTGSGVAALGAYLVAQGLLTGGSPGGSDEPDELDRLKETEGWKPYALHIGDKYYTLDWLSPIAIPLFVGANYALNREEESGAVDLNGFMSSLQTMGEPVVEMSFLQGINDVLEAIHNADSGNELTEAISTGATSYATQGIPTVFGQVARTIDKTRRTSSPSAKGLEGDLEYTGRKIRGKIPGLSQMNEPYLDVWGREQENEGGDILGRALYNALSPGYLSTENVTDVDRAVEEAYNATGDEKLLPSKPSHTIQGTRLDAKQYTEYSKVYGNTAYDLIADYLENGAYDDPEDRATAIQTAYKIATAKARNAVGIRLTSDQAKLLDELKKGTDPVTLMDDAVNKQISKTSKGEPIDFGGKEDYLHGTGMSLNEQDEAWNREASDSVKAHADAYASKGYNADDYYLFNTVADKDSKYGVTQEEAKQYFGSGDQPDDEIAAMWSTLVASPKRQGNAQKYAEAGYDDTDYWLFDMRADANGNGSISQTEAKAYLSDADLDDVQKRLIWQLAFSDNENALKKNPY